MAFAVASPDCVGAVITRYIWDLPKSIEDISIT